MRSNVEDFIRDDLALKLHLISPDLKLYKKEFFLNNPHGTRGFIDILAQDNNGNYVVIEVKRSNQAAREAIHELIKYVEGLKEQLSVRESEIKLIVASTEWRELIVPFSALYHKNSFDLKGLMLRVNEYNEVEEVSTVYPLSPTRERVISPIQGVLFYLTEELLQKGIDSHVESFSAKNISNFVLILLKNDSISDFEYREGIKKQIKAMRMISLDINENDEEIEIDEDVLFFKKYAIYSAFQRANSLEEYYEILKTEPEIFSEVETSISYTNQSEESIAEVLEEAVFNSLPPWVYGDDFEIGYPAKFISMVSEHNWEIVEIKRYGKLGNNQFLSDEVLISEIQGLNGVTANRLDVVCSSSEKSKLGEIFENIKKCLKYNLPWSNQMEHVLKYYLAKSKKEDFSFDIKIFTLNNFLYSLYLEIKNNERYLPFYNISVENDYTNKKYFGFIEWNERYVSMDKIITEFYNGDIFNLAAPLIWGGTEERDVQIMKSIGLKFRTVLIDNDQDYYWLEDYEFIKIDKGFLKSGPQDLIDKNPQFLIDLIKLYDAHLVP